MLKFLHMLLNAGENLAQLGNGLRGAGAAQREMQQSQADDRSWFDCSASHSAILKLPATLPHSFFDMVQFQLQRESMTNLYKTVIPSSRQ